MAQMIVTLELCKEDRERFDRILAALERPAPKCENCADDVAEFVDQRLRQAGQVSAEAPTPSTDTPKEEKPAEATKTAKTEAPAVDRADVQKKVVELSAAGKKAEVREIVKAYADKVSAIPEDKLAEVLDKLSKLEG